MERQLDGRRVAGADPHAALAGVDVLAGAGLREVLGEAAVTGVVLDDGTDARRDLLVLVLRRAPAAPHLAAAAGLGVGAGVLVDDELRSVTDPAVFAIGECAEHAAGPRAGRAGLGAGPGRGRGASPAQRAGGLPRARRLVTRLKAAGIELAARWADHDGRARGRRRVFVDGGARRLPEARGPRRAGWPGRSCSATPAPSARSRSSTTAARRCPRTGRRCSMVRRNSPVTAAASPTALPGRATICQCNGVTKDAICVRLAGRGPRRRRGRRLYPGHDRLRHLPRQPSRDSSTGSSAADAGPRDHMTASADRGERMTPPRRRRLVVVGNGMVGQRLGRGDARSATPRSLAGHRAGRESRAARTTGSRCRRYFDGIERRGTRRRRRRLLRRPAATTLHLAERSRDRPRPARVVTTAAADEVAYDALVLATGSCPFVPPVPGHDLPGCFVYRTLDDLDAIRAARPSAAAHTAGRRAGMVIGGGLLGLEAAHALRLLGWPRTSSSSRRG